MTPSEHTLPDGASTEGRRVLLALGYEPILTNGKVPVCRDWQSGEITALRLSEQETLHPTKHNTGLRTGELVGVDNDLCDSAHAKAVQGAIEAILGVSLLYRIGAKGSLTCYRIRTPMKKITIQGIPPRSEDTKSRTLVEFLGKGQQFIAYGMHPDTRQPYVWPLAEFSQQPLEIPFSELTEIDASQLILAAEAACEVLRELDYTDVNVSGLPAEESSKFGSTDNYPPTTAEIVDNMLARIPPGAPRIPNWFKVGAGLKSANALDVAGVADPSFDGFDHFLRWSMGEFSASGTPNNFVDEADCKRVWDSIKVGKQGGSGYGGLVYLARQHGYCGPANLGGANGNVATEAEIIAAVEEVNARFAMLTGGSNVGRIMDLSKPNDPAFIEPQRFEKVFANQRIVIPTASGKSKSITKAALFTASPHRREYTDVRFVPPGSHHKLASTEYNRWQGFAIQPKAGDSHLLLLEHIRENVCGGNAELYQWIIDWFADVVQAPGDKPGTAIVLRGGYGAGKSIVSEYLEKILGPHALKLSQQAQITGRFNSHLQALILVCIEEGFWAGDHDAEGVLKDLITSTSFTIEAKFASVTTSPNHAHVLVTANALWAVPAGMRDRRWFVLDVSSRRADDKKFWAPIRTALHRDGPANLLFFLLHHKYDRDNLLRPPMTRAKIDQILQSFDTVASWWLDTLKGGHRIASGPHAGEEREDFGSMADKAIVYGSYLAWCDKHHIRSRLVSTTLFWKRIYAFVGHDLPERRPGTGPNRSRFVLLPSLEHCQSAFANLVGCDWTDFECIDGEKNATF